MSGFGEALAGQQKYAEAEPLLLAGYEGLIEHEAAIPLQGKIRLPEAIQRLVDFYTATGQAKKAHEWRAKLEAAQPKGPEPSAKGGKSRHPSFCVQSRPGDYGGNLGKSSGRMAAKNCVGAAAAEQDRHQEHRRPTKSGTGAQRRTTDSSGSLIRGG